MDHCSSQELSVRLKFPKKPPSLLVMQIGAQPLESSMACSISLSWRVTQEVKGNTIIVRMRQSNLCCLEHLTVA